MKVRERVMRDGGVDVDGSVGDDGVSIGRNDEW